MSLYSNIVILSTSLLFAGDLFSKHTATHESLALPVSPVGVSGTTSKSVIPSPPLYSQLQISGLDRSKPPGSISREPSLTTSNPPFLRQPIQFGPNSFELSVAGRQVLRRAAGWLREHHEARILIVGSCDSGGSETCTHALAEARGAVVRKFLGSSGIAADQIVGVKGWDKVDQSCPASDQACQQSNRSARIFMASSTSP